MKRILRNKDTGNFLVRYYKSFRHAVSGIWYALKCEHNMIIILAAVIVTSIAGFYFNISAYERLKLSISLSIYTFSLILKNCI